MEQWIPVLQLPTPLLTLQAVLMASARVPPNFHDEELGWAFPQKHARRLLTLQHQIEL